MEGGGERQQEKCRSGLEPGEFCMTLINGEFYCERNEKGFSV